ncbi:metallophosphoesterase [Marinihelvus fidelis]|nr:metallophosphoesterase [Marinihelvus fidelis]
MTEFIPENRVQQGKLPDDHDLFVTVRRHAWKATALAVAVLASACGTTPASAPASPGINPSTPAGAETFKANILAFGDTGYDYDWLEADDYEDPLDARTYIVGELDDWIEDNMPIQEFRLSPFHFAEQTGGWVPASGMWPVARAIQDWCASPDRCDFGVMLGDNIYPSGATVGADGRDDAARFDDLMNKPYIGLQEQDEDFVIYPVMGNHDWETSREGAEAQLAYLQASPLYRMDGFWWKSEPVPGVEVFGIDTTLLLSAFEEPEYAFADDGTPVHTGEIDEADPWTVPRGAERDQVAWLAKALAESDAHWKIVIAHHPLWSGSGGKYEQAKVLREQLYPALCRYADMFLAGHEHTLEVHMDDCRDGLGQPDDRPLMTLVSGAAGKQRALHSTFMDYLDRTYPQKETLYARGQVWGFATLELGEDEAEVTLLAIPDDGSSAIDEVFTHRFKRRSGRDAGALTQASP